MSDSSTFFEAINISSFALKNSRLKGENIELKTQNDVNDWNSLGFHLFDGLLKGKTFNAEYSRENIPTALLPLHPHVDGRKLAVHADKGGSHAA
jgi:hypothetical protein